MRMYKCDRCGRIVEGGTRAFVRKPARAGVWHLSKKAHICRDCRDSFDAWMGNGPEEGAAVEQMRGSLERMRESLKRAYDERDRAREVLKDMKRDNERMHERLERKGDLGPATEGEKNMELVVPIAMLRVSLGLAELRRAIGDCYGVSRERALALTKLDECALWLTKCNANKAKEER